MKRILRLFFVIIFFMGCTYISAHAETSSSNQTNPFANVRFNQNLGQSISPSLLFHDEYGEEISLQKYFGEKPTILVLAYYECPGLCTQVINGLVDSLREVPFDIGKQFNILTISINPRETPDLALSKKRNYLEKYNRASAEAGWHFLTGNQESIRQLADTVGFHYAYEAKSDQYIHPSGIIVLTPEGKISKYFFGIKYPAKDLRLALVEASKKNIGSVIDSILLFCYHYDPHTNRYGIAIQNIIRTFGAVTLLLLILLVTKLFRDENRKKIQVSALFLFPLAPTSASTFSTSVDSLFSFLLVTSLVVLTGIFIAMVYFSVKYRKHNNVDRTQIANTAKLEITWSFLPLIVFMALFFWGARLYFTMNTPPANATNIYVIGKQWMWKFQHPDGQPEINELHVPIGRPIQLTMISEDVIHSFFIPAFRIKHDVLPGRYFTTWFEATKPGEYHLFCSQYCGTNHAGMVGEIIAMTPANYETWLEGGISSSKSGASSAAGNSVVANGRDIYQKRGCAGCHGIGTTGAVGAPTLQGLFGKKVVLEGGQTIVADEAYIRESILQPNAKITQGFQPLMPSFQGTLSEDEILALIAYIQSLSPPVGGTGGSL